MAFAYWQRYCTASSERQPNFGALKRGRHLCSAGRPSRWALVHILVVVFLQWNDLDKHCHNLDIWHRNMVSTRVSSDQSEFSHMVLYKNSTSVKEHEHLPCPLSHLSEFLVWNSKAYRISRKSVQTILICWRWLTNTAVKADILIPEYH